MLEQVGLLAGGATADHPLGRGVGSRGGRSLGLGRGLGGLGRLLGGLGLLGFRRGDLTPETLAVSLAADAVGLRVLDARGVALDSDPK
jgi:hypothetical protein